MSTLPITKWVACLGAASAYTAEQVIAAYEVGKSIAKERKGLLTGATTGVPYAAAIGAKTIGGQVVGISPAASATEHVSRYGKPLRFADLIMYSGAGIAGRSSMLVQSASAAIFIGGEMGTLNEFTAAWLGGCPILGVLQAHGGISDRMKEVVEHVSTSWGSLVIYDTDAVTLALEVCALVDAIEEPSTPIDSCEAIEYLIAEYQKTQGGSAGWVERRAVTRIG